MVRHTFAWYHSENDYLNAAAPFLEQGFKNNAFCILILLPHWDDSGFRNVLQARIPDVDAYIKKGQFAILNCEEWYGGKGEFDPGNVLAQWKMVEASALADGFSGVCVCADGSWFRHEEWEKMISYERTIDQVIHDTKLTALCMYSSLVIDPLQGFALSCCHEQTLLAHKGAIDVLTR